MKASVSSFHDYLIRNKELQIHPKVFKIVNSLPSDIKQLHNVIFYGPKGVGKYTQVLSAIKKYSPTELKYEKKLGITFNKQCYFLKISDIHFEIDMSLLSCNSKVMWNEMFNRIFDVVLTRTDKSGIILCKNFQEIHRDLLDTFYSYMQDTTNGAHIVFILVSDAISFIPENIIKSSYIIYVSRPSKTIYDKCTNKKLSKDFSIRNIDNIKQIRDCNTDDLCLQHKATCDKIIDHILNVNTTKFALIREKIYDTLIYDMNIYQCTWYIIEKLIKDKQIKEEDVTDVLLRTYSFFHYYNNNYRPIYHLESFICYLVNKVNGFQTSV